VAYFEVLSGYLPEGTVENLSQDKSPGWDVNLGPPEYKSEVLLPQQSYSAVCMLRKESLKWWYRISVMA
jgi:hypothetical protein